MVWDNIVKEIYVFVKKVWRKKLIKLIVKNMKILCVYEWKRVFIFNLCKW